MNNEKVLEKIKKLLEVTMENGATENEAKIAALKAQKLMAEYGVKSISGVIDEQDAIANDYADTKFTNATSSKWCTHLAIAIAKNFRCKFYISKLYSEKIRIYFFGHDSDVEVCVKVYEMLLNSMVKLSLKAYREEKANGRCTKGFFQSYNMAFIKGIKEVLDAQCTALALVIPNDVVKKFNETMTNSKTKHIKSKINHVNEEAFKIGFRDGKSSMRSRELEGA